MRSKSFGGILAVLCLVSLVVITAAGTATAGDGVRDRISRDLDVVVLVSGCDGLVAPGGVPAVDPFGTLPYPYSHNFVAALHEEGWSVAVAGTPFVETHTRATGAGTDAAGEAFTVQGTLTLNKKVASVQADFWADDGNITVRRADGAFARGQAVGADAIVTSPPLLQFLPALTVTAKECHLR